ncbi:hypothetical protein [Clostridium estertheticum]|uniref:Uncharacterized protein n=1 Tax=Clostridium estertheticum TaxID=238834 RepID=A0AA47EJE1_9CLOT|nr:hypothetical protein [Clostridium estertheticum]MBU3153922.1 hypothetical protein [Clostridium estertheticum]WAG61304.1 hypothetical protein LL038_03360 [Clostridium estertheticum]
MNKNWGMKMKELTLTHLEKLDIISIEEKEIENLRKWYTTNIEYLKINFKEIKDPFQEVVILYKSNLIYKNSNDFNIYCYDNDSNIKPKYIYGFEIDFERNKEKIILKKPITDIEFINKDAYISADRLNFYNSCATQDLLVISLIYSYLAFNEEHIIKQTKIHTHKTQSKKDKRGGKKPKVKLTKQTIITFNTDYIQPPTEEEKREYERHILGWTVRGHWRTYKSGNKIWIKPQIRGDKEQVQGKVYEI